MAGNNRRCSALGRALYWIPNHCKKSDRVWEAYYEPRPRQVRLMLCPVVRAAQMTAILPPPPGRCRSLLAVVTLVVIVLAAAVAARVFTHHAGQVFKGGFQLALHAYLVENLLEALQAPLIVLAAWCNLRCTAPTLAALLSGPLHPGGAYCFTAFTAILYIAHVIAQVIFHIAIFKLQTDYICISVASCWASFSALTLDRLIALILTCAAMKIRVVNRRLSSLPQQVNTGLQGMPTDHPVQRSMLLSVVNRWEATMEQVSSLLGHRMLGLPLMYSLLHVTIGLVTASSTAIRDSTVPPIRLLNLINVVVYLARVASLSLTAGWVFREAKETETVIGALDTTMFSIRERQRVQYLLRLSRDTERLRVCGIVSIDQSFLFTVMGNTVTYLVMLLQYPILTPGKAAAALNKTETKSSITTTPATST